MPSLLQELHTKTFSFEEEEERLFAITIVITQTSMKKALGGDANTARWL